MVFLAILSCQFASVLLFSPVIAALYNANRLKFSPLGSIDDYTIHPPAIHLIDLLSRSFMRFVMFLLRVDVSHPYVAVGSRHVPVIS